MEEPNFTTKKGFDAFRRNGEVTILSRVSTNRVARLPWGEKSNIRLSSEEMGGALSIFDYRAPVGFGPPRHVHHREDEILHVVSGQAVFWTPESSGGIQVGDIIKLPKGVEHTWRSYGTEPVRYVFVMTPGGFEGFFQATEKANLTEDDIAGRSRVVSQFGVEATGGPLTDFDVSKILNGQHPSAPDLGK